MVTSLRQWFERQPGSVRLGLLVALCLLGVVWVSIPDDPVPAAGPAARPTVPASERPVLARDGEAANPAATSGAGFLAPYQEPVANAGGVTWYGALRAIVSVAIVLALIVVGAQGLRAIGADGRDPLRGGVIRVRETVRLPVPGARNPATLHLVEVGERLLLVGASDGGVSLVTEFEQDEVGPLPGAGTPRGPGAMARMTPRRGDADPEAGAPGPDERVRAGDEAVLASVLQRLGDSGRRLRGDG